MSENRITKAEFSQLAKEWSAADITYQQSDDPAERQRAWDRCIEIEQVMANAPFEFDDEGNVIEEPHP